MSSCCWDSWIRVTRASPPGNLAEKNGTVVEQLDSANSPKAGTAQGKVQTQGALWFWTGHSSVFN